MGGGATSNLIPHSQGFSRRLSFRTHRARPPPPPPHSPTFNLVRNGSVLCVKAGLNSILRVLSTSFTLSCARYVCETESGVMCLDFHPEHPNFIAAGFYDGM